MGSRKRAFYRGEFELGVQQRARPSGPQGAIRCEMTRETPLGAGGGGSPRSRPRAELRALSVIVSYADLQLTDVGAHSRCVPIWSKSPALGSAPAI
jgi:hypothetical protein